jgi:transcriptional regulator with XRE-family HTH domain
VTTPPIQFSLFAIRLRDLREEAGFSQADFGAEVAKLVNGKDDDYSQGFINKLETDLRKPSFAMLVGICRVLKCSADYILGLRDHPNLLPSGKLIVDCALYEQLRTGQRKLHRGEAWASAVPDGTYEFKTPKEIEAMTARLPADYIATGEDE